MPLQVQSLRPDGLLLVSTLDGSLHALSKQTGDLKWTLKDGERGAVTPPSLEPELEWCPRDAEDKNVGSRIPQASVCRQRHHLAAVWPWESHSTSLSLSVLTCKMKPRVTCRPSLRVLRRMTLHTCPRHTKHPGNRSCACQWGVGWGDSWLLSLQIPSSKGQSTSPSK